MNLARHRLDEQELPLPRRLAIVARSFFLQSAWSFERMQSVGFATLMSGEGKRLTRGRPDAAAEFLKRHLTFFNTNPPMAGYLAGVSVRLEEAAAAASDPAESARLLDDLHRFKRAGVSAFAAWGDTFFWATLRPAATAVALLVALFAGAWGALAWLIVYNAAHLHYRYHGVREGYRYGPAVAGRVGGSRLKRLPDMTRRVGLLSVGALVPLSVVGARVDFGTVGLAAFPAVGVAMVAILRRRGGLGWEWGLLAVILGIAWSVATAGR
ncbi:MAG TPA: PTS system mannose/fructose/sorbose family transporter subunit IID [Candidatus Eisenbacteria bacterium]